MKYFKKTLTFLAGIVFLTFSASWLFAPGVMHGLRMGPNLISKYESSSGGWAEVFRLFDALAAGILITAVLVQFQKLAKKWGRYIPFILIICALMMILDVAAPVQCHVLHGVCVVRETTESWIHGLESILLSGLIAAVSLYIADRYKYGRWFLGVQVVSFVLALLARSYDRHWLFAIQASYQILQAYWFYGMVFVHEEHKPPPNIAKFVRLILAAVVAADGAIAITLAWHNVVFGRTLHRILLVNNTVWLTNHTLLIGLLLLYFARQLKLGDRRAYLITSVLLLSEIVQLSLVRNGWIFIPFFGFALLTLIYYKDTFDRRGKFTGFTSRLRFIASGLGVLAIIITLGTVGFRIRDHRDWVHSPFDTARVLKRVALLEISADADDPPSVRLLNDLLTILGVSVYGWIIAGIFLPESSFHPEQDISEETIRKALSTYSDSSEDYFKIWPNDKRYYKTSNGSFVTYAQSNGVILALANPIGKKSCREGDVVEFLEYNRDRGFKSAWILLDDQGKDLYESVGYKTLQIGSSAAVDIEHFCKETVRNKWWRWQLNRSAREGYEYKALVPPHSLEVIEELRRVSDKWLTRPGHREQGFALGYFDNDYLQVCRLHCLYDKNSKIVAFANEVPIFAKNKQTTVDMIRFDPDAVGAMQALLAESLKLLMKEDHYTHLDLGFVPLAKVDSTTLKLIKQLFLGRFSAEGLTQFKNKFEPTWSPNYLAYDGDRVDFAKVLVAINKIMDRPK